MKMGTMVAHQIRWWKGDRQGTPLLWWRSTSAETISSSL